MPFSRNWLGKFLKKYYESHLIKDPEKQRLRLARIYAFLAWNLLGITIFYFCDKRRYNSKEYYEVLENGELVKLSPGNNNKYIT